jgi:hypothetical protein
LRKICEPFWPGVRAKVDKIWEHIRNHKALMTETVTLEDIVRAQEARNLALSEYDRAQKFRDYQAFCAVRDEVNPDIRYEKLANVLRQATKGSGSWLDKEEKFINWLDPVDRTVRCFWLCGIPGAGKLHIPESEIISQVLNNKQERHSLLGILSNVCRELDNLSYFHSSPTNTSRLENYSPFSTLCYFRLSNKTHLCRCFFPTTRIPTAGNYCATRTSLKTSCAQSSLAPDLHISLLMASMRSRRALGETFSLLFLVSKRAVLRSSFSLVAGRCGRLP